jgi:hypothetical protein
MHIWTCMDMNMNITTVFILSLAHSTSYAVSPIRRTVVVYHRHHT